MIIIYIIISIWLTISTSFWLLNGILDNKKLTVNHWLDAQQFPMFLIWKLLNK